MEKPDKPKNESSLSAQSFDYFLDERRIAQEPLARRDLSRLMVLSRSDGAVFGGTDKRWYSAEPCHPFLAITRAAHANPVVLIDELEKAGL